MNQTAVERAREALKPHELEEVERLEAELEDAPEHVQAWVTKKLIELREGKTNG